MKLNALLVALLGAVASADLGTFPELENVSLATSSSDAPALAPPGAELFTAGVCPKKYPLYCAKYNFCCRRRDIGCCKKACCLKGTTHCHKGHCYK